MVATFQDLLRRISPEDRLFSATEAQVMGLFVILRWPNSAWEG